MWCMHCMVWQAAGAGLAAPLPQSWHCLAGTSQMKQKHCTPGSSASVVALRRGAIVAGRRQKVGSVTSSSVSLDVDTGKTGPQAAAGRCVSAADRVRQYAESCCARCCRPNSCLGTQTWKIGARCIAGACGACLGPTSGRAHTRCYQGSTPQWGIDARYTAVQPNYSMLALHQHAQLQLHTRESCALRCCTTKSQSACAQIHTRSPAAVPFRAELTAPACGTRCAWLGRAAPAACGNKSCVSCPCVLCKVCSAQGIRQIHCRCAQATAAQACRLAPGRSPARCPGHLHPWRARSRLLAPPAPAARRWPPMHKGTSVPGQGQGLRARALRTGFECKALGSGAPARRALQQTRQPRLSRLQALPLAMARSVHPMALMSLHQRSLRAWAAHCAAAAGAA